jgi:hypothetical protein
MSTASPTSSDRHLSRAGTLEAFLLSLDSGIPIDGTLKSIKSYKIENSEHYRKTDLADFKELSAQQDGSNPGLVS